MNQEKPQFSRLGNGLADELDLLLFEIGLLSNRLRQTGRSIHQHGLPAGSFAVLQSLEKEPRSVPEVARLRSTSRQTVQVIANRLRKSGLVEPVVNPAHKRSDLIRITPQGARFLSEALESEAAFLGRLLPHTSEREVLSAAQLLRRLRGVLSGEPEVTVAQTETVFRQRDARKSSSMTPETRKVQVTQAKIDIPDDTSSEDELPVNLL